MSRTGSPSSYVSRRPLSPPPESQASHRHQPIQPPRSHHPGDRGSDSFTSSPLMSDSPQNYESSFTATKTSPAQTTLARSVPSTTSLSSPPSSFAMSTQTSQHPSTTTNSFPTPASSVSGQLVAAAPEEFDGATKDTTAAEIPTQEGEASIKKERRPDLMEIDAAAPNGEASKQLSDVSERKVTDNAMELDPRETGPPSDPGLAALQTDIGQAFHLCKTSYSMSGPDPSLDLVSLYGLGPVAASVARTDPITGEKINRLRKSYEGKIKPLGLAGRNKPVRCDPGTGGLRQLTMWPEEEWYNQNVYGKEIKVAEPDSTAYKTQMRAMRFEPGPVPDNEYWEDVLGHEKQPKPTGVSTPEPSKKPSVSAPVFRQPSYGNGTPTASTPNADPGRPKRAGKKRSYTDDSFVGYGDGFPEDDDLEGSFYSNSEAGSSKKKRKKDHMSGVPSSSFGDRGGSYGVGMFGVGAR